MFVWCICIYFNFFFRLDILQFEIDFKAMRALYDESHIVFGFICHHTNAKSAQIIPTATRNQYRVEIAEANRTAVFEYFLLILLLRVIIHEFDLVFLDLSSNSYFVSVSQFF